MADSQGGIIPMENILNLRDVGATVNQVLGKKVVREGMLFRSARPDWATPADRHVLSRLGITSIIDLRTEAEQLRELQKHAAAAAKAERAPTATLAEMRIPGIEYHDAKVTGGPFDRWMLAQLSWFNYIRCFILYYLGYRIALLGIIGKYVMEPLGLLGLIVAMIDVSGQGIAQALHTYITPHGLPSLVHCSQGKDRTGLIAAFVLMILDVPVDAIDYDYRLSDGALDSERESRLRELHDMGLSDHWIDTDPVMIKSIRAHVDAKWGGLDAYLDSVGFGANERNKLREALLY